MIGPVIVTPPLMQIASSTSFAPPVPLYRRLASDYVTAMEMGTLQAGERMPSVRELMHRHQVSLSTALQMLRHRIGLLLALKPDAKGLVLPGMPMGSPGMEMPDGSTQPYTVELVQRDGTTSVFAQH